MRCSNVLSFIALTAIAMNTQAQTPRGLDDLLDIRASSGERELKDRGYRHHKTLKVRDDSISYWWDSHKEKCIAATTRDGRYVHILEQPQSMCRDDDDDDRDDRHRHRVDNVSDIKGMRARSGADELEDLGYRHRKSLNVRDSEIGYWWNSREKHCVAATVKDGRFDSIMDQPEMMCDK